MISVVPPSPVRPDFRRRCIRRAAYVYIAVLFTTLIVMASVTAALAISTSYLKGETNRNRRGESLRLAEAEIHRLASLMQSDADWRTTSSQNVFSDWHSLVLNEAGATKPSQVRFRYFDQDGDLADDLSDSVELTVHARVGSSATALSVELESAPLPLKLLEYSVTSSDDIDLNAGTLTCELPVQVFDNCKTNSWGVLTTPRLEIMGRVEPTLRGDLAAASITLPSHDVVGEYISQGTELPVAALPLSGSDLLIQDVVLSPTANPFGSTNASGIYWIQAGGAKVVISNCRLNATLAIKGASVVEISGGVTWNYPTTADVILASDSKIELEDMEATLDETNRGVNFNPATSPYRGTLFNTTSTDVYPTELRGIIYTPEDLHLHNTGRPILQVTGAIICSNLKVEGFMTIKQLSEVLVEPPLGLRDPTPMRFVRGTFRRVPAP